MKSRAALLGLLGLAAMGMSEATPVININSGGTDADKARHIENLKRKGVKEFVIDGKTIYARSYENALKKLKN